MTNPGSDATAPRRNPAAKVFIFGIKMLIPLVILGAGAGAVYAMMKTAPQPQKASHERRARLVAVVEAAREPHQLQVESAGTVMPSREVTLSPQVAGEVIEVGPSLEPGGYFETGELVVKIDPSNYELAAQMREAELTQMEARQVLEQANQDVAKREYEVLGEALDAQEKGLVLREPQLSAARADVAAARAMLEDARLDLARTTVTAPFNAQVVEKMADVGARVTTQSPLVRLVGTETYWVELNVKQSDLRWIELPGADTPGSPVELRQPNVWGPDAYRTGRVIRLLPDLSAEGSMARVLVAVDDPLCLRAENRDKPKLLVGQYVVGLIEGATLDKVVVVDWNLLRNGDYVWIMDSEDTLDIRAVEIAYRGAEKVLVRRGIEDGERIVSTDIATVAKGMKLRLGDDANGDSGDGSPTLDRGDAGEAAP